MKSPGLTLSEAINTGCLPEVIKQAEARLKELGGQAS